MGLKSGTNAFWKARNVTYRDLVVIHQKLFNKSLPIRIDVDVSILNMSVLNNPKHTYSQIVMELANSLVEISSCGFEVTPVFDGLERHIYPTIRSNFLDKIELLVNGNCKYYMIVV